MRHFQCTVTLPKHTRTKVAFVLNVTMIPRALMQHISLNDINKYLVDDELMLRTTGVSVFDAHTKEQFTLRHSVLGNTGGELSLSLSLSPIPQSLTLDLYSFMIADIILVDLLGIREFNGLRQSNTQSEVACFKCRRLPDEHQFDFSKKYPLITRKEYLECWAEVS